MLVDLASGLLVYAVLSPLFGEAPSLVWLASAVSAAFLPDADFLIYVVKKRLGKPIVSHHFIHHPFLLMPACLVIGGAFGWWYEGKTTYGALIVALPVLMHLVHDTFAPTGMSLWPVRSKYISFHGGIHFLFSEKREELLEKQFGHERKQNKAVWERLKKEYRQITWLHGLYTVFTALGVFAFFLGH